MKKTLNEYGFPSNYSAENKYQVYDFLINIYKEKSYSLLMEKRFKVRFSILYNECISYTSYPTDFTFQQKLYHYFNDDKGLNLGLCKKCNKRCHFVSFQQGYFQYCCNKCLSSSEETKKKRKQTKLERYGDEKYYNLEKAKQTKKEKY